jgi:hypothetical protein
LEITTKCSSHTVILISDSHASFYRALQSVNWLHGMFTSAVTALQQTENLISSIFHNSAVTTISNMPRPHECVLISWFSL